MDVDRETMPSPEQSDSTPQCRLLALPAELRNRIYEYVFNISFKEPRIAQRCNNILHLCQDESPPRLYETLRPRPPGGFNQLKYVCRFLHRETCFLEVKYNTIKLCRDRDDRQGPAQQFASFIKGCSERKARMITRVVLDNDTESWTESWKTPTIEEPHHFVDIAAFCRLNPNADVRYIPNRMEWNVYSVHNVMELGVLINLLVRGIDLRPTVSPRAVFESEFEFKDSSLRSWFYAKDVAQKLDVPNLRFWPLQGSSGFDEEAFREKSGNIG